MTGKTSSARDDAMNWLVKLTDASADMDITEFEIWRQASPEHADAFEEVRTLWADLGFAEALDDSLEKLNRPTAKKARVLKPRPWSGWRAPALAAAAFAVVAFSLVRVVSVETPASPVLHATEAQELQTLTLADGSSLTLGPESRLSVSMNDDERRVDLQEGEAFFHVARAPDRPFIIAAGEVEVSVLGTKFDVRRGGGSVRIGVQEGRVSVKAGETSRAIFGPGEGALIMSGLIERREDGDAQAGAWRLGRLVYENAPLSVIVDDLDRYTAQSLRLESADLGSRRITASFEVEAAEAALEGIALTEGLDLIPDSDGTLVLKPAH